MIKKNLKMKIVILMGEESNKRVPDISSSLKEFSTQEKILIINFQEEN